MVNSFISYQVDDINIHLEHAATWGRAAGGVGAEEDEVGEQDDHLGGDNGHEKDKQSDIWMITIILWKNHIIVSICQPAEEGRWGQRSTKTVGDSFHGQ